MTNTMLRLKNIKIGKKTAEADYYPEGQEQSGHISVDLSTNEIISCDEIPGYGASYRGHARQHLVKMAKEKSHQEECVVMWY